MSNRLIIGFTAPKGSGKDLAWKIIEDRYYYTQDWRRVAFADPIKDKICNLYDIHPSDLEILKRKELVEIVSDGKVYGSLSGRDFVRNLGMMMRDYDETQFNRYVESQFIQYPKANFVVTDVRFQNEADLIHQYHGYIVEIQRPGFQYDHHITESGKIKPDLYVTNNGTVEQFELQIVELVELLRHKE